MSKPHQIRQLGLVGLIGGVLLSVYAIPDAFDPGTFSGRGAVAILYGEILIGILMLLFSDTLVFIFSTEIATGC